MKTRPFLIYRFTWLAVSVLCLRYWKILRRRDGGWTGSRGLLHCWRQPPSLSQHLRRAVSFSSIAGFRGGVKVNGGPLFPPVAWESHCWRWSSHRKVWQLQTEGQREGVGILGFRAAPRIFRSSVVLSFLPTRLPQFLFSSLGAHASRTKVRLLWRRRSTPRVACCGPGPAPALPRPSHPLSRAPPPCCTDTVASGSGAEGRVCSRQRGVTSAPRDGGCARVAARVTERLLCGCAAAPTPKLSCPPWSSQLLPDPPPRPPPESLHTLRAGRGRPRGGQRGWRGGRGLRLARAAAGGARRSPGRPPDTCSERCPGGGCERGVAAGSDCSGLSLPGQ